METQRHCNLRLFNILSKGECEVLESEFNSYLDEHLSECVVVENENDYFMRLPVLPSWDELLSSKLSGVVQQYVDEVGEFNLVARSGDLVDEGYIVLGFPAGGFSRIKIENTVSNSPYGGRLLVVWVWVNDLYRGGELVIFPESVYGPRVGDGIVFPATWEYGFFNRRVESGMKWCVLTYVRLREGEYEQAGEERSEQR